LVTNRHVVIDEDKHFYPDHLIVRIHASHTDVDATRDVTLPLYDAQLNPIWREHQNKAYDLVLLNIGSLLTQTDKVVCWGYENLLSPTSRINVGSPVWVIGYPMAFFERQHYLPIVRSGMLSTTYGLTFNGLPTCLVDANLHQGTSGSPVLVQPEAVEGGSLIPPTRLQSYIVGINSGVHIVNGVSLGLNEVWYGRLIMDILEDTPQTINR